MSSPGNLCKNGGDVSKAKRTPAATRHIDLDALQAKQIAAGGLSIGARDPATVKSAELERLGLELQVEFDYESGRSQIIAVHVRAARGVTVNLLRQLPLADVERQRDKELAGIRRLARKMVAAASLMELKDLLADLPDGERRRVPPRFYRLVADVYLTQVNAGSRSPSAFIAEATRNPLPTVQGWVRRARLRGHLPPARRGAAG